MMKLLSKIQLLPSEDKFYRMIEDLAASAETSTKLLKQLVEGNEPEALESFSHEILQSKARAKKQFETLTAELCQTFITPFDREDIQAFGLDLYKVTKIIEKVREQLVAHHLRPENGDFNEQVAIILKASDLLEDVVKELHNGRKSKVIFDKTSQIQQLEEEGDALLIRLTLNLFDKQGDTRDLILRKDVYDMLEQVLDYHRDAANVALRILLKHS
jgi:uncharacterized protein Yka (UPF0111/DUF47 family)